MKTILVIDDEPSMLTTIAIILRSAGYEVDTAQSGEAGLRQAYERIPDLVICDVNLPDLDGTTVLQALREDPATSDRQVVLITGADEETFALRKAMNIGADDFLHKPFSPKELIACVEARLRRNDVNRHVASRTYDHLKHTLHSTLPHEFFAPIASILGVTEMLRQQSELPREESLALIGDIERHARKLHRSFDNYIKLIELETHPRPRLLPVCPADQVWQAVRSTAQATAAAKDRGADLRVEGLPQALPLNVNDLSTLVEELVDNACSYSRKGSAILVNLSKDEDFIRLEVGDHGRGMTEAQVKELREAAHPTRTSLSQDLHLHGIGMLVVQKLVDSHGGGVQIYSQPSHGTRITLFWPTLAKLNETNGPQP